ncbi:MAG: hypothetical protein ACP5JV_10820 [Thermus sp.]|uniref:hypothetical protein n=1 Tax=Thermus sp. TaxID=275 RepID=UPI003D0FFF26
MVFLISVALLLSSCGGQAPPPVRATLDWTPLAQAAGPDGSDGPIALTGTLEGTPSAPSSSR